MQLKKDRSAILRNLREALKGPAAAPLKNFQSDGTWSDIDYADRSLSEAWSPSFHLNRTFQLAAKHPELAVKALDAWQRLDPSSQNWWWGCIGTPQRLCNTILLIGPDNIPSDLLKKLEPVIRRTYSVFPNSQKKMTGQNLVWVEEIRLCTGLIYHDPALVSEGRDIILSELKIAEEGKEGLKEDFTYHQHGCQNQIGNYGLSFLATQLRWARTFKGTALAYTPEQIALLDQYFMECLRWVLIDGIMDYNFCGRQLMKGSPENKYRIFLKAGRQLQTVVPEERKAEYRKWLKDPAGLTGAKAFYRSGALVYRAPDWYFSLRMSSAKLKGCETIIGENLQGRYQEDGFSLFGSMKRYQGFPPLFDQRLLPGTTEVQDNAPLFCDKHNIGGFYAVLAQYPAAIAAMRLEAEEIQADKVWFCTSSGVYCSGSDIRSSADAPVVTTVDQYRAESEQAFPVKYEGKNIQRKVETRTGNWKESFEESPSQKITGKVVTLTISHGVRPDGATCRYAMLKKPSQAQWLESSSPRIHALAAEGKILTAAFTEGSVKLPDGRKVTVRKGIALWSPEGKLLEHADFRVL